MIYSDRQIEKIRAAAHIVGSCHQRISQIVSPGITTAEIDAVCESIIRDAGAVPAFKGYRLHSLPPFPSTICASPDSMIVHGIPTNEPLKEGTLLAIDVGANYDGYFGDAAWTYPVGAIDDEAKRLMAVGERCLFAGIEAARAGNKVVDIGRAITAVLEGTGFSTVRDYVGHGCGRELHEKPQIPHFVPSRLDGAHRSYLSKGMTIAIEPMTNAGTYATRSKNNEWPVFTADGKRSVHFEHQVLVTDGAAEILTAWEMTR
mgnify:CR=1 FL=1